MSEHGPEAKRSLLALEIPIADLHRLARIARVAAHDDMRHRMRPGEESLALHMAEIVEEAAARLLKAFDAATQDTGEREPH